jgi:enamine deaminase RidA (YjgF/YER057c/UK114 family)
MNKQYTNPKELSTPRFYTHAISAEGAGKLVFISGQVSWDAGGKVVGKGDFAAQFHQVFDNLGAVLKGAGGDFRNVVKFTTFFVHSQDIETFMRLRAETFPKLFGGDRFPPNTILVVDRLVKEDFLLEVEAVAQAV